MKTKRQIKRVYRAARVAKSAPPLAPLPDCLASAENGEAFDDAQQIAALEWLRDCLQLWVDSGALTNARRKNGAA